MKRVILSVVASFAFLQTVTAQNLTGTWEGNTMGEYCKLVVVQYNDSLFGYTYDTGMGYCKADFVGTYDSSSKKVKGRNTDFIEKTLLHGKSVYRLHYSKIGDKEYLSGTAVPKSIGAKIASLGLPLTVRYTKTKNSIDSTKFLSSVLERYTAPGISSPENTKADTSVAYTISAPVSDSLLIQQQTDSITAVKQSRQTVVQQYVYSKADTIYITLYDDGDIDGDIVTIFDNGKIIAHKLLLTKAPYHIKLTLPANNSKHLVELMAENEGSIPPNTAYMLVVAGSERVEVKASSNALSNAAIVIQRTE